MTSLSAPTRSLPERIRWARKRAGYSQEQFAAKLGTSRRHVIRWENVAQPTKPTARYVALIAAATGQPEEMFRDEDDEEDALQALAPHLADALIDRLLERRLAERRLP